MVNQVGSPAMFEGNRFLPETGMPIRKIERRSTRFAVWLPDPLTVATRMLKSFTTRSVRFAAGASCTAMSETGMHGPAVYRVHKTLDFTT